MALLIVFTVTHLYIAISNFVIKSVENICVERKKDFLCVSANNGAKLTEVKQNEKGLLNQTQQAFHYWLLLLCPLFLMMGTDIHRDERKR
jgi:hypothetical protein